MIGKILTILMPLFSNSRPLVQLLLPPMCRLPAFLLILIALASCLATWRSHQVEVMTQVSWYGCGDNLKGLHPPVGHLYGHIWYGPNEYILEWPNILLNPFLLYTLVLPTLGGGADKTASTINWFVQQICTLSLANLQICWTENQGVNLSHM